MKAKKTNFTLLELLVSMAVFSILMYILLTFFDTAQKTWTESYQRTMIYENARVAFDLIERDLQAIYYSDQIIPFWHKGETDSSWSCYRNDMLAFVAAITPPNSNCESKFCEIKYQLYYAANHNDIYDGYLMRSVTGDKTDAGAANTKWNFINNLTVGATGASNAFTANGDSSEAFEKIIPYVTSVVFTCYTRTGTVIAASGASVSTELPYSIKVDITFMDRNSFKKWQLLDKSGSSTAATLKQQKERIFSKTFLIGERGQYD